MKGLAGAVGLAVAAALFGCTERRDIAAEYDAETTALATESGTGLPFFVGRDLRPVWKPGANDGIRRVLPFEFSDQMGRPVSLGTLAGKVTVVSFFFTGCGGICPTTMTTLRRARALLAKDDRVLFASFSVAPEADTPEVLRQYGKRTGVDPARWRLLTGPREALYRWARESFEADTRSPGEMARKPLTGDDFLHSEEAYLVDGRGRLRGAYLARTVEAAAAIAADARRLLEETAR